jgi:hypothetical protein
MFRLLLVLGAGLFLALLIGGRDEGQTRMGLQGAYDIAALRDAPAAVVPAAAPPAENVVAAAAPEPVPQPVAPTPAAPDLTEISFAPATDSATEAAQAAGLTLSLPLVTADAPAPVAAEATADPSVGRVARVIGSTVNVRAAPSAKADILSKLARNEAVTVIAADDSGWTLVRIEGDGVEGYIASRYLADAPVGAPASVASALFPSE